MSRWAGEEQVAIVTPWFDTDLQKNELAIVGADGLVVAFYEKQHPSPVEPKRHARMAPGPFTVPTRDGPLPLSSVICVDLDYTDLVRPVRRTGGVLVVPANDWPEIEELHHRTAVWAAVMSGVPLVRATGNGMSAIYDGAGHVLQRRSSLSGPVVLVADVPLASPT